MPELDFAQLSKQLEPRVLERLRDPRLFRLVQNIIDSGEAMPAVAVGMFLDEVPAGSAPSTCVCCGDLAVLGPEQQRVLASRTDALILCIVCTLALMSYFDDPLVRRAKDEP